MACDHFDLLLSNRTGCQRVVEDTAARTTLYMQHFAQRLIWCGASIGLHARSLLTAAIAACAMRAHVRDGCGCTGQHQTLGCAGPPLMVLAATLQVAPLSTNPLRASANMHEATKVHHSCIHITQVVGVRHGMLQISNRAKAVMLGAGALTGRSAACLAADLSMRAILPHMVQVNSDTRGCV